MENDELHLNLLMIPIWPLYNVKNINDINFDKELSDYLKEGYSLNMRKSIYLAMQWAGDNPNYPFINIMKNAPNINTIKFNNNDIHTHLMHFKTFMEDDKYGLLTEDNPSKEY